MRHIKTKLRELTSERCASIAQSFRLSIAHFRLSLNPTSPLAIVVKELEWMGSFPTGPMMKGGAGDSDRKRVVRVIPLVEQAERIAIALERIRGVRGAAAVVSCLRDNIDRLQTLHERAQDLLFEIEVGGRLAARGLPVAFGEPDLLLEFPRVTLGLPCKRPRGANGIIRNLRDAIKQLERAELAGVVVLSIEPIVHPPAPGVGLSATKPATMNWMAETHEEVDAAADEMLRQAIEPQLSGINRVLGRHRYLGGVLFCGVITAWLRNPSAYAYRWLSYSVTSPHDAQSPSLTELLGQFVRGGQGE